MAMAMVTQATASSLTPSVSGSEDDDGVAHVLVDGRTVRDRNRRHFRQIMIEQACQIF
jgi:hypothetical protein